MLSFIKPDYRANNILNMMSSLGAGLGASVEYPLLESLSPSLIGERKTILFIVIDGLGYEFLQRYPNSFLYRHVTSRLATVFPSTTASAISTFNSGLPPCRHGMTGWFTYLSEVGTVAAVLPFLPRFGGPGFQLAELDAMSIYNWEPFYDRVDVSCNINTARDIVNSQYSIITGGSARRYGYGTLNEFYDQSARLALGAEDKCYIYAYWPKLDTYAHQYGIDSEKVQNHFSEIDAGMAALAKQLQGSDTLLLISADHGLVDTSPAKTLHINDHPRLRETLTLPLCGEPRAAYCYVRPSKESQFLDYVETELAHACDYASSDHLLAEGYFGEGAYHPRIRERVGDYVLMMKDCYVIKDQLATEQSFNQIGVHGGLSSQEMYVPFILIDSTEASD